MSFNIDVDIQVVLPCGFEAQDEAQGEVCSTIWQKTMMGVDTPVSSLRFHSMAVLNSVAGNR